VIVDWTAWRPASCYPSACFCEAVRDGWVRQPANAVSSLSFVIVALMVVTSSHASKQYGTNIRAIYVLALLVIGLGSALYHASLTFAGQFVDVFGMYLIATFVILYNLRRTNRISDRSVTTAYVLSNVVLAIALFTIPVLRRYLFGVLIAVGLLLEVRNPRTDLDTRHLRAAALLLAAGFVIWVADITGYACSPNSLMQGHAVWHILGAMASWKLYRFYAVTKLERVD